MEQIQKIRRDLHQIPELDKHLPKTIAYIKAMLTDLRCVISEPAESSICAYFDFHQHTAIAFRSDMDALPIEEKNEVAYRSQHKGKMHACGHDGHMAILLAFAGYLHKRKHCKHNVLLVFQPAEETSGGAQDIVKSQILAKHRVKAVFGIHLWPQLPEGTLASKSGYLMARSAQITVTIKGKAAHIAAAEKGYDALYAACCFIQRMYEISDAYQKAPHLLKFGQCNSGSVCNAISDYSCLQGSLRVFHEEAYQYFTQGMHTVAEEIQKATGCRFDIQLSAGYPALYNDPRLFQAAQELFKDMRVLSKPNLLSEDFAYYGKAVPGLFLYLGVGQSAPLHSDIFDFDDRLLRQGVKAYRKLLEYEIPD